MVALSIDYFRSLPLPKGKNWGQYALVFSKDGEKDLLYLGSGRKSLLELVAASRCSSVRGPTSNTLPEFVRLAFENWYTLMHFGFLAWMPILMVALEALFTFQFRTAFISKLDHVWAGLFRFSHWSKEALVRSVVVIVLDHGCNT
jgi:hypothetical protein